MRRIMSNYFFEKKHFFSVPPQNRPHVSENNVLRDCSSGQKRITAEIGVGGNYISGMEKTCERLNYDVGSKVKMYKFGMSSQEARSRLNRLLSENRVLLVTSKDGNEARINRTSVGKMLSPPAVNKSIDNGFSAGQHYAVASDIVNVYNNSVKVSSRPDRHGHPDVTIHRLVTPLHFDDGAAYITVKETIQGGNRIHSLELIEIGKLERTLEANGKPSGQPFTPNFPNSGETFQVPDATKSVGQNSQNNLGATATTTNKITSPPEKSNSKSPKK